MRLVPYLPRQYSRMPLPWLLLRQMQPPLTHLPAEQRFEEPILMSRAFILYIPLIIGSLFAAASGADVPVRSEKSTAEWPQWRGPNRDGISPDTGLLKDWTAHPPKLLWTADGMGAGYA